jgi:hypothetical protein
MTADRTVTHLEGTDFQKSRAFSPAVVTQGGKIVWLAGQTALTDLDGKSIAHDKAGVQFLDGPGRREAAFRHRERPRPEVRCSTGAPALPGKSRNARLPLVQTPACRGI